MTRTHAELEVNKKEKLISLRNLKNFQKSTKARRSAKMLTIPKQSFYKMLQNQYEHSNKETAKNAAKMWTFPCQ